MRTINSHNSQQVIRAASKLIDDFIELGRVLFAFFRPVKIKSPVVIADNQMVNPPDSDKSIKDGRRPVAFSELFKVWHEMESWDLVANATKPQPQIQEKGN